MEQSWKMDGWQLVEVGGTFMDYGCIMCGRDGAGRKWMEDEWAIVDD